MHMKGVVLFQDIRLKTVEAAHISPYKGEASNDPSNGLLLRSDLHILFDLGLISVNPDDLSIVVAHKLL